MGKEKGNIIKIYKSWAISIWYAVSAAIGTLIGEFIIIKIRSKYFFL